jgi:hypothetical protein
MDNYAAISSKLFVFRLCFFGNYILYLHAYSLLIGQKILKIKYIWISVFHCDLFYLFSVFYMTFREGIKVNEI